MEIKRRLNCRAFQLKACDRASLRAPMESAQLPQCLREAGTDMAAKGPSRDDTLGLHALGRACPAYCASTRPSPLLLQARRKSNGSLTCDACGDGPKTADDLLSDAGFEAHHTIPLQQAGPQGTATRVGDLALLCATCHRLLHRAMQVRKTWLSIEDFKAVLASREAVAAPSDRT